MVIKLWLKRDIQMAISVALSKATFDFNTGSDWLYGNMGWQMMRREDNYDDNLSVVMTHDDTGHSCFSNSPLPGLSSEHFVAVKRPDAKNTWCRPKSWPHSREESSWEARQDPWGRGEALRWGGGTSTALKEREMRRIICWCSVYQMGNLWLDNADLFRVIRTCQPPGIRSEGASSGKRSCDWLIWEAFGETRPPTMYHGRSGYWGGSDLGWNYKSQCLASTLSSFCSPYHRSSH